MPEGAVPPTAVAALTRVSASRLTSRSLEGHVCAYQHGPTGDLFGGRDNPRLTCRSLWAFRHEPAHLITPSRRMRITFASRHRLRLPSESC